MCAHIFWACECVRLACAAAAPLVPTYLPRLVVPTYVVKITETFSWNPKFFGERLRESFVIVFRCSKNARFWFEIVVGTFRSSFVKPNLKKPNLLYRSLYLKCVTWLTDTCHSKDKSVQQVVVVVVKRSILSYFSFVYYTCCTCLK